MNPGPEAIQSFLEAFKNATPDGAPALDQPVAGVGGEPPATVLATPPVAADCGEPRVHLLLFYDERGRLEYEGPIWPAAQRNAPKFLQDENEWRRLPGQKRFLRARLRALHRSRRCG